MGRRKKRSVGRRIWLWGRRIVLALLAIALVPLALTWLYRLPAVHPISTLMLQEAVTFNGYVRRWTPLEQIGEGVVDAVMMSEDGQFCSHRGVDIAEMRVLIEEALAGEETRGGSTITMQTVKNLFLWHGRSYLRKAIELPLSVYFDMVVPKDRIMEIYLNIAEWGPGIYGVEAASWYHFGKSTGDLNAREAALLAVTLPNPIERDPAAPSAGLNELADIIQRRAKAAGDYVGCVR